MILILGQNNDASTVEVAEWLDYYKKEYLILNTDDSSFKVIRIDIDRDEFIIESNGKEYDLSKITSVWNRRLGISANLFTSRYLNAHNFEDFFYEVNDKYHYQHLKKETEVLFDYLHYVIERKSLVVIGSYFTNQVNKLIVLDLARECGLKVPRTMVITNKNDLKYELDTNPNDFYITKPLSDGIYRPNLEHNYIYYSHVERIDNNNLDMFAQEFYPSLVQKEIKKYIDIRTFYIMGAFYSMAIFSQDEEEAIVDFRKNDHYEHPLKSVPFKLPDELEHKLSLLMEKLNLNTGSIDLILDDKNTYYFLEVNPCGQYAMTALPCNYNLNQIIANTL